MPRQPAAAPVRHLTAPELADRLGIPLSTLYAWNAAGKSLDYIRAGRHIRYSVAAVERWEADHTVRHDW